MGAAAGIAQGVGAVANLGSAVNSGVKGARAQKQLNVAQDAQDKRYAGMMDKGMGMLDGFMNQANQYNNPALAGQILTMGQNAAGGMANNWNNTANALNNQGYANQAAGILGGAYQNNVNMPTFANNVNTPGAFGVSNFNAPGMDKYSFDPVKSMTGDMVTNALAMGDRARQSGLEQAGMQSKAMGDQLSTALAGRGLAPNSGAMAAALSQNALGVNQNMANLERGIADMAGNAALQGAQLDTANQLQLAGMGSQYNLGMNQLTQQSALNAFNANLGAEAQNFGQQMSGAQLQNMIDQGQNQFGIGVAGLQAGIDQSAANWNLGRSQGLVGIQGMRNDVTMQQGQLRHAAYADPLNTMQGIYQQNYLAPGMQMTGMLGNMAGGLFSGALAGQESGLDRRVKGVEQASSGKGTAMSSGMGSAESFGRTMQGKQGAGTGAGVGTGYWGGPQGGIENNYGLPSNYNYNPDQYRFGPGY